MKLHRVINKYRIKTTKGIISYSEKSNIKYGLPKQGDYIVNTWKSLLDMFNESYNHYEVSMDNERHFIWVDDIVNFSIEKKRLYKDEFIDARFYTEIEYINSDEITMQELNKEISVNDYIKLVGDSV